jgi:predicted DNA-binding transcriptional regulator AlpA
MKQQIEERYVNIDEAAQFLSIKKSWLYQNHKLAGVPSHYIGRKLVFKIYELDAWVQNRTKSA